MNGGGRREQGGGIEVVTRVSSMFDRRRPRPRRRPSVHPSATGPFGTATPRHCRLEVCVLCCPFKVLRVRGKCSLCSRNWRSMLLTFFVSLSDARFPPLLPRFPLGPKLACEEDKSIF